MSLNSKFPLCIDLDGTLLRTDVLSEALLVYIYHSPWKIFNVFWWFLKGRAYLKKKIADRIDLDFSALPVNQKIVDLIHDYRNQGHSVLLVTAAPKRYGLAAAHHFGFFDDVMTSQKNHNLRSQQKAMALSQRFGQGQFIYAGNSVHDLPVWEQAGEIIAINTPASVLKKALELNKPFIFLEEGLLNLQEKLQTIFKVQPVQSSDIIIFSILILTAGFFWRYETGNIVYNLFLQIFLTGNLYFALRIFFHFFLFVKERQAPLIKGDVLSQDRLLQALISGAFPLGSACRFGLIFLGLFILAIFILLQFSF